jgi:hypothetical protein
MPLRRFLPLAALALALAPAAPAAADQAVAAIGRAAPVAGYGGWEAWSPFDEAAGTYTPMISQPGQAARPVGVPPSTKPFDVALGPDDDHDVVAVYRSCGAGGCDIRRYDTAGGHDVKLRTVSSPSYDEATPAIWGETVVFTRRVHGCDVPYVKNLRSSAPGRRLLKHKCLTTPAGHASIRGSRIVISSVDLSHTDRGGAGPKTSELRRYSSRAGGSLVIARQTFGEESNLFGQVAQDDRFAYTVRIGFHRANTFVRVPWSGGRLEEVRAFRTPTDAFAKYRIVLPAAGADPWYTAVAATPGVPTWAGRGTVGSVAP